MQVRNSVPASAHGREAALAAGNLPAWGVLAVLVGGLAVAIAALLPAPLFLATLSALLVGTGFILAAVLYLAGSRIAQPAEGAWMIAGALVFLGFAAALLSDSAQVLAVMDQIQSQGIAAVSR